MLDQDWIAGPLDVHHEILGIPVFWLIRIGKLFQFVAGLVILVEIFGEARLTQFLTKTLESLQNASLGNWALYSILSPTWTWLLSMTISILPRFRNRWEKDPPLFLIICSMGGLVMSLLFTSEWAQEHDVGLAGWILWPVVWYVTMLLITLWAVLMLFLIVGGWLVLPSLLLVLFARLGLSLLRRHRLSFLALRLSLFCLILGAVLEFTGS